MKIIINKIEEEVTTIVDESITVTKLKEVNFSDATEGSYLVYSPVSGENIQANTLIEMQQLYNTITNDIEDYNQSVNNPLNFAYRIIKNGYPYDSDENSQEPFCLEIL